MQNRSSTDTIINDLIAQQNLPSHFIEIVHKWYLPLCENLVQQHHNKQQTLYVSINGCQGSGKSTMALFIEKILTKMFELKVANLSIDDFYLTRKERKNMAEHIHPLLITRGVPGTHDIPLAIKTLKKLATDHAAIELVRFNKAIDDRADKSSWHKVNGPMDVVILEGWCMGLEAQSPQALYSPINELEGSEDANGKWRNYVNDQLAEHYPDLFQMFDTLIMLKAPSFECVYQWRRKQEEKLRQTAKLGTHVMNDAELARFIQHYQRLTEHAFATLPAKADIVFELGSDQHFQQVTGLSV
ncbi:hypothetical protein [Catenovulum sediminis]|uniref:Kinase n=1 Tax=Catenovulum sediminis TaxID=1740262 RepID=A0ABV1RH22_9ALTE